MKSLVMSCHLCIELSFMWGASLITIWLFVVSTHPSAAVKWETPYAHATAKPIHPKGRGIRNRRNWVKLMKDGPHYGAICVTDLAAILLCSSIDLHTLILFDNCLASEINHYLIFLPKYDCERICTFIMYLKGDHFHKTPAWKTWNQWW